MYDTQRQKTQSTVDEVTANIAEYAAMAGLNYASANLLACINYPYLVSKIHSTKKETA